MSAINQSQVPEASGSKEPELLRPADQAAVDVAHASTGWNAHEVWKTRVFRPAASGYNKPDGNT
jgi:hypothetical protein